MTGVLPRLDVAFAVLTGTDVRWCLLRGRDRLEHPTGDVDLLVHADDAAAARGALAGAGFVTLRVWARGTQGFLLGRDSAADAWVYLHMTTETSFGPLHALRCDAADAVLRRAVPVAGVPMPHPDDRFWYTLLHGLLDKGHLHEKHREALLDLAREATATSELARALDRAALEGAAAAAVLDLARSGRWADIEAAGPALAQRWASRDPSTPLRALRHRGSLLLAKIRETITRRGLSVALLAPDGAGKSTLAETLRSALFFRVSRFYLGLEGGPFAGSGRSRVPLGGFFRRLFHLWSTWLRARTDQARRRIVIFDRYPYEALLPAPAGAGSLSRWRRAALGRALPAPDLVVVLDAPGDVLHRRKAEHTPERLERDRQGYRELARRFGGVVIDATQPPDRVRRDVVDAVWAVYLRRYGKP